MSDPNPYAVAEGAPDKPLAGVKRRDRMRTKVAQRVIQGMSVPEIARELRADRQFIQWFLRQKDTQTLIRKLREVVQLQNVRGAAQHAPVAWQAAGEALEKGDLDGYDKGLRAIGNLEKVAASAAGEHVSRPIQIANIAQAGAAVVPEGQDPRELARELLRALGVQGA